VGEVNCKRGISGQTFYHREKRLVPEALGKEEAPAVGGKERPANTSSQKSSSLMVGLNPSVSALPWGWLQLAKINAMSGVAVTFKQTWSRVGNRYWRSAVIPTPAPRSETPLTLILPDPVPIPGCGTAPPGHLFW